MSTRDYQSPDWTKPYILRIDNRQEQADVEELFETPRRNISVPVSKPFLNVPYKDACMHGHPHPLDIEHHHYVLVTICTQSIDSAALAQTDDVGYMRSNRFSPAEQDFINSVQLRSEIAWAVDNSFDGIYVQKFDDFARGATSFKFAVYMKEEQATFWKLKFSGQ